MCVLFVHFFFQFVVATFNRLCTFPQAAVSLLTFRLYRHRSLGPNRRTHPFSRRYYPAPSAPPPPSLALSILPTPLPSLPLLSPLPPPRALLALAPHFCTPFPVQFVPYFSTPAPSSPTSRLFNRPTPPPWHTRRRSARCSRPWRPAPPRRSPLA